MDDIRHACAGLTTAYQPVVDLDSGEVVGYEALARPGAGPLSRPDRLIECARSLGELEAVEWACRTSALRGALGAGFGGGLTLFVNVAPDVGAEPLDRQAADLLEQATADLRVVLEVTERAVLTDPARLLRTADWARDRGWGIALDDLGADPGSLAMMPFLEPDVIKLDLQLVQRRPDPEIGLTVSAVMAQAERSRASVVAEGIETAEHQDAALAMGATLGQGWLYGRPGALPPGGGLPSRTVPLLQPGATRVDITPYAVVRAARPVRRGTLRLLLGIAGHLEEQAVAWRDGPVVLSTFSAGEHLPGAARDRYETLARQGSFVVTLGSDVSPRLAGGGVRNTRLPADHRLGDQWCVVVVGPHYAGALVAQATGRGTGAAAEFDFAVTHDRDLVIAAGRTLLREAAVDASPDRPS